MKKIHIVIDDDIYVKLWEITKRRYISPVRKFHIVVNEALREYIQRHEPGGQQEPQPQEETPNVKS
jgi:hypothetical protein